MHIWFPLLVVILLALIPLGAAEGTQGRYLFGIIIPYAAFGVFLFGSIYRVWRWGKSPVPFRIPTTCGQQKSLPWIRSSFAENPSGGMGVLGRMALEVLLFRSLFRNTKVERAGKRPVYGGAKWLWLAGLTFHYALLLVLLRHLRFFTTPAPSWVEILAKADGFFEIGVPALFLTDATLFLAAGTLLLRRVMVPRLRYISLPSDYFPLFLIIGAALSGFFMRHFFKVDLFRVKELAGGWFRLAPVIPEGIGPVFYVHLFLVCVLFAYLPMSKLMHMGGVFLSPTRNLANNSRARRHINPWDAPVKVHTYAAYEDEFRSKMKAAGLPVEKE